MLLGSTVLYITIEVNVYIIAATIFLLKLGRLTQHDACEIKSA